MSVEGEKFAAEMEANGRRGLVREAMTQGRRGVLFLSTIAYQDLKVTGNEQALETAMNHLLHATLTLKKVLEKAKGRKGYTPKAHRASAKSVKLYRDSDMASVLSIMGRLKRKEISDFIEKKTPKPDPKFASLPPFLRKEIMDKARAKAVAELEAKAYEDAKGDLAQIS